jgi:hypothetical protein
MNCKKNIEKSYYLNKQVKSSKLYSSIPTHSQVQDNYHTRLSFLQHLGAIQEKECVLLVLDSSLMPT